MKARGDITKEGGRGSVNQPAAQLQDPCRRPSAVNLSLPLQAWASASSTVQKSCFFPSSLSQLLEPQSHGEQALDQKGTACFRSLPLHVRTLWLAALHDLWVRASRFSLKRVLTLSFQRIQMWHLVWKWRGRGCFPR